MGAVGTVGGPEPGSVGAASAPIPASMPSSSVTDPSLQGGGGLEGECTELSWCSLPSEHLTWGEGGGVGSRRAQWSSVLAPSGFTLPALSLRVPVASLPQFPTCKMGMRVKYSSGGHGCRRADVIDALRTGRHVVSAPCAPTSRVGAADAVGGEERGPSARLL